MPSTSCCRVNTRVLCTGDLLVNQVANLIDGYVNEWPDTLEKLKPIDFVDVIPGTYTLRITGPGIQPYVVVLDVAAGQAVARDIAVAAGP